MKRVFMLTTAKLAKAIAVMGLAALAIGVQAQKKSTPAPKAPAPAKTTAAHPKPNATRPVTTANGDRGTAGTTGARGGTGVSGSAAVRTTPTRGGGEVTRSATGQPESFKAANGNTARFDSSGHVREVHAGNSTITHGPGGTRHIVAEGPNHTRYVTNGRGQGYVQRPYMYHGHAFEDRTYYRNGVARREFYRPYYYNGVYLHGYYPAVYYSPAFYGWAYAPWGAPVAYRWGWAGSPWYGAYGPYFTPYPVYATASLWLTDYLIANSLQQAYAAGVAAGASGAAELTPSPGGRGGAHLVLASYSPSGSMWNPPAGSGSGVALTPEIKQAISEEVALTLNEEKAAAGQAGEANASVHGVDQLLSDGKSHVFVASDAIEVPGAGGQDCALSAGDVLQLNAPAAASGDSYQLQVLASKENDCQKASAVTVSLENLQEMHNSLMATVDQGLGDLQKKAGQGGLPAAPAGSQATTDAPYASAAPPPDPNGAQQLATVAQEGDQADQQVVSEATSSSPEGPSEVAATGGAAPSPAAGPVTIALGQTPAQVVAGKGQPSQIVNLGAKKIYVYPDMKVYFTAGKVSNVE